MQAEERKPLRTEQRGQERMLLRREEPRPAQGLHSGPEQGQQRRLLRAQERGPLQGPQRPQ